MKPLVSLLLLAVLAIVLVATRTPRVVQAESRPAGGGPDTSFAVTASGSTVYRINAVNNPTLTLTRGQTVVFNVNALGHPFYIKTSRTTGTSNQFPTGVTGQGSEDGPVTFVIPANAPSPLFYQCGAHSAMGGSLNFQDPLGVDGVRVPTMVWLGRATPNPAGNGSRMTFGLPRSASVDLGVFDPRGRRVALLVRGIMPAGEHSVRWDGRDGSSRKAPSGVYFYRLAADGQRLSGRVIVTH